MRAEYRNLHYLVVYLPKVYVFSTLLINSDNEIILMEMQEILRDKTEKQGGSYDKNLLASVLTLMMVPGVI